MSLVKLDPELTKKANKHTEERFGRLKADWILQRRHESSTYKMAMMPAYQSIIGIGPDAVPLMLKELEDHPDMWFWALRAITEADPVTPEMRGDVKAMASAWLAWGKAQGFPQEKSLINSTATGADYTASGGD